ncbi:MAG TPA: FixH family protein [Bacteroidia bacterium]|jgi:hypothetical protein|nr:FixH family protein [Bacteroidia bacterium]HRG51619.1 FixH family protein [Bacteroidia bacterium]
MSFNWGVKITVLYLGFVSLIVVMVSMAMHQKIDLVSKDYYEQELNFQEKINKSNRANELKEPLTWDVKQGSLHLKFPQQFQGQKINGTIFFFRPSDAALDKIIPLAADTLLLNIPTSQLKKGLYKMQINWKAAEEEYYNEGIIQIN